MSARTATRREFARRFAVASALLFALFALPPRASAQERRTNAERGGPVALCSTTFAWTAEECAEFLGERRGARLCLAFGAAPDPLSASTQTCERVELEQATVVPGDDATLVARIERASAIELVGGTWIDWWPVFYHWTKTTRLALALREAQRRGVPLLAADGAASHLAHAAAVPRSMIGKPRRNPRTPDPDVQVAGLGLAPVVWETAGDPDASLAAVLRVLLRRPLDGAAYATGAAALVVEPGGATARVLARGDGAVLFVDITRARRLRESLREGRVTLGGHGARWDLVARAPLGAWSPFAGSAALAAPRRAVADALAPAVWIEQLRAAAWSSANTCALASRGVEVRFALTPDTLRDDAAPGALARVAFDVDWEFPDPGAAPADPARVPAPAPR